jgi:hypothetical protein
MYAKSTNRDNCDKGTLSKKKTREKKNNKSAQIIKMQLFFIHQKNKS